MEKYGEYEMLIKEYLNDKMADYAILIDGEWGCGKTYFYDKKVEALIKSEKFVPIYVSLYGLTTIKEVENYIHSKIIEAEFPDDKVVQIMKKAGKIGIKVLSACKGTVESTTGITLPNVTTETIYDIMKIVDSYERYVFVFDDLERCNIPINTILGYINNWVEHKKCKSVLIANQVEVTNNVLFSDLEGKLYTAFQTIKYDNEIKKLNCEISTKEIIEKAKLIFNSNSEYNQIREKLIGLVIYYVPNFDDIFKNILANNRLDCETVNVVNNQKKILQNELVSSKHINIRTLRAIIFNYDKIIKQISGYGYKTNLNYKPVMNRLLYVLAKVTIKYKKGNITENKKNSAYEIFDSELEDKFKFIDTLVQKGTIDKSMMKDEIDAYFEYESAEISDTNDPLKKISNIYKMEDDEIISTVEELKENLEGGKYSISLYPKIISCLVRIKMIGFSEDYLNDSLNIMKDNIKEEDDLVNIREYGLFLETMDQKMEYDKAIKSLKEIVIEKNSINELNNILKQKKWGNNFYIYVDKNRKKFREAKKFLSIINLHNLRKVLKKSTVEDIYMFRCAIIELYAGSGLKTYFEDDLESIQEIDKMVISLSTNELGINKKHNLKILKSLLDEAVSKLTESK